MKKEFLRNKQIILNNRAGFTFIEVVMSILIIAVVAMYLATAIPTSLLIVQETEDISKATDLAQQYFENVKYELSSAINYDAAIEGDTPPIDITDEVTDYGNYSVVTNITSLESETIGGNNVVTLKRLDITLTKPKYNSPLVSLSTELSRPRS